MFADTHVGFERRHPGEIDWWRYHSRRGWEDTEFTGIDECGASSLAATEKQLQMR